jgi:HlyD family secretion protein
MGEDRRHRGRLEAPLLLLVAALATGLAGCRGGGREAAGAPPLAEVEVRDIVVVAEAAGLVEPVRVVEVKSNASGEVLRVEVESGDTVEAGALLAEIDPRDVQSAVDQTAADLASARVGLDTARAEERRSRQLLDEGLIPPQEHERTVQARAAAQAALVRTQTAARLAREKREDAVIRAPIAGTVIERTVEPGTIIASATSNVSGGTTLFRMADLAAMQVRAKVDEVDIGSVHPGDQARVTVEAHPGRTFPGVVAKIEPQAVVEQNVTLFPVLVRVDNPAGLLLPGMNADVTLDVATRAQVPAVPNGAIVQPRELRATAELLGVEAMPAGGGRGGEAAGGGGARLAGSRQEAGPPPAAPGDRDAAPARRAARSRPAAAPAAAAEAATPLTDGDGAAGVEPTAARGRSAMVFVQGANGPEPRRVVLGLSDWEYTEVLEGVEPGEQVVLASALRLQAEQAERTQRMRERFAGPLGGGTRSGGGSSRGGTTQGGGAGGRPGGAGRGGGGG